MDRSFVYYYFQSVDYWRQVSEGQVGIGQPNVNGTTLSNILVPLPPLPEQRRIVAKLEKLLAKVEASQKRLERIPTILKRFRQSVLAAACSGRLTEDWRSGREVVWGETTIGEVEEFIGSGITPKGGRSVYVSSGIPFIRSQNVYPSGLVLDDVAYITPEIHRSMSRTHIRPFDVLLNITGASIGRSTVVPGRFKVGNVNQHVCIIRVKPVLSPRFLSLFLNSPLGQGLIFETQNGVTREGLNYGQIRSFVVPLPSIEEQNEIVRRADALLEIADKIEGRYEKAKTQVEKLAQSILAKAFCGELVPQNPNDEPASALLERVKQERQETDGPVLQGRRKSGARKRTPKGTDI